MIMKKCESHLAEFIYIEISQKHIQFTINNILFECLKLSIKLFDNFLNDSKFQIIKYLFV